MSMSNWTFSGLKGWITSNLALTFWTQSLRCVSQIHITDPWTWTNSNRFANDLCTLGFFSRSLFLVARKSHLIGCFWLFAPKFCEVVGTYEWYFVILWMQVQCWGYQTLPYAEKNCFEIFALTGNKHSGESRPKSYHCGTFTTFNCSSGATVSLAHVKMSPILSQWSCSQSIGLNRFLENNEDNQTLSTSKSSWGSFPLDIHCLNNT